MVFGTPEVTGQGPHDEEWVSQKLSHSRPDIDSPRPQDFGGVSVILGRLDVESVYRLVVKAGKAASDDGVRYARVGELRAAGFEVVRAPTNRNPAHLRVERESVWSHGAAVAFVSCFSETVWFDQEGGDHE